MIHNRSFLTKICLLLLPVCILTGCGQDKHAETAIALETAADAQIDFAAVQAENPNIFGWLYIPGTQIDCPVLQDVETDEFYANHNAFREKDAHGAVYIELANRTNMCDFNTVFHGNAPKESAARDASSYPFADLYRFADPDFFEEHETLSLYLDGNVLTYEIFAAYERDDTSLIRNYDFTYAGGCYLFLDDLYSSRLFSKNLREGWSFISPYHFLITLTAHKEDEPDRQFVVIAVLIQDEAGTVSRVLEDR